MWNCMSTFHNIIFCLRFFRSNIPLTFSGEVLGPRDVWVNVSRAFSGSHSVILAVCVSRHSRQRKTFIQLLHAQDFVGWPRGDISVYPHDMATVRIAVLMFCVSVYHFNIFSWNSFILLRRYNELRDPAYQSKLDISNFTVMHLPSFTIVFFEIMGGLYLSPLEIIYWKNIAGKSIAPASQKRRLDSCRRVDTFFSTVSSLNLRWVWFPLGIKTLLFSLCACAFQPTWRIYPRFSETNSDLLETVFYIFWTFLHRVLRFFSSSLPPSILFIWYSWSPRLTLKSKACHISVRILRNLSQILKTFLQDFQYRFIVSDIRLKFLTALMLVVVVVS